MKKRIVATLLTTLLTAATMTGCGNNYTVALTDTNPVKVELGTELSTDVRDYITVTDGETTIDNGEVFEDITLDTTNVDVNAVGTYTVTYKVADAAGNEAVAERVVTVEKKATPKKGKTTTPTAPAPTPSTPTTPTTPAPSNPPASINPSTEDEKK